MKKATRYLLIGSCYLLAAILMLPTCMCNSSFIAFALFAIDIVLAITNIKKYFQEGD